MPTQAENDAALSKLLQKMSEQKAATAVKLPPAKVEGDEVDDVGEPTWSLGRVINMLRRKAIIIGFASLALSGVMGLQTSKKIPMFKGSFRLLVEPVVPKTPVSDQLTDTKSAPLPPEGFDYFTQIEVLYSPTLLKPLLKEVGDRYPGSTFDVVVPKLVVERLGETKIIEISYVDTNPDKALLILQKLAQGYLEYSRNERQSELRASLKFVNKELPKLQERVDLFNRALEGLRQKYGFFDPGKYSDNLEKQILTLAQARQKLRADLAVMQLQVKGLRDKLGRTAALSKSPDYQALIQKFQVMEQQIAIEAARFGPNSPNIQLLKRQRDNMLPILLKEAERTVGDQLAVAENELQLTLIRYQTLTKSLSILENKYQGLPQLSRQFTEFQRDLEVATASLKRFLQTQESLQVQLAKNDVPWQLLSEPEELRLMPGGSPLQGMLTGAMVGIFLGIVAAVMIERLENTFYVVEDIPFKTRLPVLGIIPLHPDLKDGSQNLYIVDLKLGNQSSAGESLGAGAADLKQRVKELLDQQGNAANPEAPLNGVDLSNRLRRVLDKHQPPTVAASSGGKADLKHKLQDLLARHKSAVPPEEEALLTEMDLEINPTIPLDKVVSVDSGDSDDGPGDSYWLREYDAYGFMEAFRTLATNLLRKRVLLEKSSMVLTSALPGEGRSTTTIHLAQAIAAMGKRTLLVDAHLRRGSDQIDALLGLPESKGLSEYLSNQATLSESIQRLSWESNLFVMPAGEAPPDPTRLLASEKMQALVQRFENSFDFVIYSMPPLMGLADVKLVAEHAGAVVLVTRIGRRGSADALAYTKTRLLEAKLPVLGVIANGVKNYKVDLYA